ncbi:hypothetical protein [Clostridium perfringens]|uniref:hypothetical protein n=1 Tax=Clostridium perfringens TaxID=1502 RepID=UPI0023412540|nr:hypothetical protein [Clostridium perfringens]MDC4243452.1 hypothetical protein [Clostridium perfringens]
MGGLNKGGRPQKFDENKLIQIIEDYINNEHDKEKPIKITRLAKYLKEEKGLNIIYQDLSRKKKVKNYIDEYNNLIKSKVLENTPKTPESNTAPAKKKIGGRPRKFDEEQLLIAVKGYVKSFKKPALIKKSRIAKHFQEKGINITYQDLDRYAKVKKYIEDYNQKFKDILFAGVVEVDIEKQTPIFEHINPIEFLKNNKTPEQIEKALEILNKTNEKLVESYEQLQNKIIAQNDDIIAKFNEIERLNSEIELLKLENKEREEKLKSENKKLKNNLKIKARKMALYEEFICKYHYSSLAEYASNLENGCSNENLTRLGVFFDEEKYLQGDFKLKDVADKYMALNLAIDNTEHQYIEENEYDLESSGVNNSHSNAIGNFISEANTKSTKKSEETEVVDGTGMKDLKLTTEDIDSSLAFLDKI